MTPPEEAGGDVLVRRLAHFAPLTGEERAALEQATDGLSRASPAKRDLIREGDPPRAVFLITSGWACRYKTLADGRRQTLQFLLPGDLCDVRNDVLRAMDHGLCALTPVRYREIAHDRLAAVADAHPRLERALWWQVLVGAAIQREWTLNNGQRTALERIGHLFCELYHRLRPVGLTDGTGYAFPLTQPDLADATGLTPVHVNRTLQDMRATGLIVLKDRMLRIPDLDRLASAALFTPDYLHVGGHGSGPRGGDGDGAGPGPDRPTLRIRA